MVLSLISLAESTSEAEGINPFVVGGVALAVLLFLLLIVVGFGGGRDHT